MAFSAPTPEAPHLAALRGDEAAVRSWLERGGRANTTHKVGEVTGFTLLMDAAPAGQGHERVAALLLQHGTQVNLQSSEGATALMLAAQGGHKPFRPR